MRKSVEELFRDAPPDATHYNSVNEFFYRFTESSSDYFSEHDRRFKPCSSKGEYAGELIPRPQPKPWSGPEDGLPPVGTVCEHKRVHEWQHVEVFAIKPNYNGSNTALFTYGNGCWGGCAEPSFFRAIKTAAQIAKDQRETAIRELMDIAGVDCRVTAARLVDAGFKREVV